MNTPLMTPMTAKPMVTLCAMANRKYHSLTLSCNTLSSQIIGSPKLYRTKNQKLAEPHISVPGTFGAPVTPVASRNGS